MKKTTFITAIIVVMLILTWCYSDPTEDNPRTSYEIEQEWKNTTPESFSSK